MGESPVYPLIPKPPHILQGLSTEGPCPCGLQAEAQQRLESENGPGIRLGKSSETGTQQLALPRDPRHPPEMGLRELRPDQRGHWPQEGPAELKVD